MPLPDRSHFEAAYTGEAPWDVDRPQKAFVDAANARQQAVRGTFDPMYLSYTLGKLMIRDLKAEWLKANPGKTMRDFHDALLSYGCAPLPLIRRAMLGTT